MVVDIGEVKRHIKPKADSTLRNMRKDDLIEYIRCLEHNYNVGATFLENQARYIESLGIVEVVRCGNCKKYVENNYGDIVCQHPEQDGDWLDAAWLNTNPDDFCSYGERKPE